MSQEKKATLLVILSNVIYGCSFLMTTIAIRETGGASFGIIGTRFLIAFLFLSLLVLFRAIRVDYRGKPVYKLILVSVIYPGIYFISETLALGRTSSAVVGVTIGMAPILVALMSWMFLHKKQNRYQLAGILLSIAGVVVLNGKGMTGDSLDIQTVLILFTAVFTMSLYSLLIHQCGKEFTASEMTYFMVFMGALEFNLLDAVVRRPFAGLADCANGNFLTAVLFLGILTSGFSSFALNYGLCHLPAIKVSVLNNITSVVSVICGVLILHEPLTAMGLLGCTMIVTGCIGYSLKS